MLTADEYMDLDPDEAQRATNEAGAEAYCTERWKRGHARATKIGASTITEWFAPGRRPPVVHYLYLAQVGEIRRQKEAMAAVRYLVLGDAE